MTDHSSASPPRKWVFDKTLNIPTMLMISTVTASAVLFVAKGWSEQERRIDAVERTTAGMSRDMQRLETTQTTTGARQSEQLNALRSEFRSDLRDINSKLDTLILGRAGSRPETKDWTRP